MVFKMHSWIQHMLKIPYIIMIWSLFCIAAARKIGQPQRSLGNSCDILQISFAPCGQNFVTFVDHALFNLKNNQSNLSREIGFAEFDSKHRNTTFKEL